MKIWPSQVQRRNTEYSRGFLARLGSTTRRRYTLGLLSGNSHLQAASTEDGTSHTIPSGFSHPPPPTFCRICPKNLRSELWVCHTAAKQKHNTMNCHRCQVGIQDRRQYSSNSGRGSYWIKRLIAGKRSRLLRILTRELHSEIYAEWMNDGWWKKWLCDVVWKKMAGGLIDKIKLNSHSGNNYTCVFHWPQLAVLQAWRW